MSLEQQKIMISEILYSIADDIASGPSVLTKERNLKIIFKLYDEGMRKLSEWYEMSGPYNNK